MTLPSWPVNIRLALAVMAGLLVTASLASAWLATSRPEKNYAELRRRVRTWWLITAVFLAGVLFNRTVSVWGLGQLPCVQGISVPDSNPARRPPRIVLAYLAIPIQYYWVWLGWYGLFIIFIPVYMLLLLPLRMVLIGET